MFDTENTRKSALLSSSAPAARAIILRLCDEVDRLHEILNAQCCHEIVLAAVALERHETRCDACKRTDPCHTYADLASALQTACRKRYKI